MICFFLTMMGLRQKLVIAVQLIGISFVSGGLLFADQPSYFTETAGQDSLFEAEMKRAQEEWDEIIKASQEEWKKELEALESNWKKEIDELNKQWEAWVKGKGGLVDQDILIPSDSLIIRRIVDYDRGLMEVEVRAHSRSEKESKEIAGQTAVKEIQQISGKVRVEPDKTINDSRIVATLPKDTQAEVTSRKDSGIYEDKTYRTSVTVTRPLYGPSGVMKDVLEGVKREAVAPPVYKLAPSLQERAKDVAKKSGPFTGLIVDARGLRYKTCLLPQLVSPDGQQVYGSANVELNVALNRGMAAWTRTEQEARTNGRAGANPIMIKAEGLSGAHQIELKEEDAVLIAEADNGFLQSANVVILVD